MIRVKVTREGATDMELDFDQPSVTLGRGNDQDVQLPSSKVSRHHATLQVQVGVITIVDAGSSNGTYVGHDRIEEPRILTFADVIHIGDFTITATSLDEPGPTKMLKVSAPAATAKPSAPQGPQIYVNPWPNDD